MKFGVKKLKVDHMCRRSPLVCWLTDRSSTRANQPPRLPNFHRILYKCQEVDRYKSLAGGEHHIKKRSASTVRNAASVQMYQ